MRLPGPFEQVNEVPHFFRLEMGELLAVTFHNLRSKLLEELEPRGRDAHKNDPAIVSRPLPVHQPPFDKPIKQARDIRRA